ncbi:MAG: Tad domain-containing protein [Actinomycetes bacterium]
MHRILSRTRTRPATSCTDDSGAVTLIFVIVVLMGIMAGLFALVVDGGQLLLERRVVQNAADATLLSVAQSCAIGVGCTTSPVAYAQNNSPDLATSVDEVCGTSPLLACAPSTGQRGDCQTTMSAGTKYARVRTSTLTNAQGTALAPAFARMFGDGNVTDGSWTLHACSQAKFGRTTQAEVLMPFAISVCNFTGLTTATYRTVFNETTGATTACSSGTPAEGSVVTANYKGLVLVSLPTSDVTCTTPVHIGVGTVLTQFTPTSAASVSNLCGGAFSTRLRSLIASGTNYPYIYVPVYSTTTVTGGVRTFTVASFARIAILGYKLNAAAVVGTTFTSTTCTYLCVAAQFAKGVTPIGKIDTSATVPAFGVQAVELVP